MTARALTARPARFFVGAGTTALALALGGAPLVLSATAHAAPKKTVTICHATGGASNPYVTNRPSETADAGGHDGHRGAVNPGPVYFVGITVKWGDIIPPFDYAATKKAPAGSYPGLNWTSEGQAIFNNGCSVPSTGGGSTGGTTTGGTTTGGSTTGGSTGGTTSGSTGESTTGGTTGATTGATTGGATGESTTGTGTDTGTGTGTGGSTGTDTGTGTGGSTGDTGTGTGTGGSTGDTGTGTGTGGSTGDTGTGTGTGGSTGGGTGGQSSTGGFSGGGSGAVVVPETTVPETTVPETTTPAPVLTGGGGSVTRAQELPLTGDQTSTFALWGLASLFGGIGFSMLGQRSGKRAL